MGMNYSETFHDATIILDDKTLVELTGLTVEHVRLDRPTALDAAVEAVNDVVDEMSNVLDADGTSINVPDTQDVIDLNESSFCDHASYSYQDELNRLLLLCEPGAYIHDIDCEDSTGEQSRAYVIRRADGTKRLETITPELIWHLPTTFDESKKRA